jgi:hypothetical protein
VKAAVSSPLAAGVHPRARVVRRRRRRLWLLDEVRRDTFFSSPAAFFVSFAICLVGLGFGAYYYALWTLGVS